MRILSLTALTLLLSPLTTLADETKADEVTFAEHIAPLVFKNCTTCHRPGQVAPFSLMNYADTRKHAKTMFPRHGRTLHAAVQPEPGHGDFPRFAAVTG